MDRLRLRYLGFTLGVVSFVAVIVALTLGFGPYHLPVGIATTAVTGAASVFLEMYFHLLAKPRQRRQQYLYAPLLGELERLGPNLLTPQPVTFQWDEIGTKREQLPENLRDRLTELESKIEALNDVNDEINVGLGLDEVNYAAIAEQSFPDRFVDGTQLRIELRRTSTAERVPLEKWLFVYGAPLLAASDHSDLARRIVSYTEQYDRFEMGPRHWRIWNDHTDEAPWEEVVWQARSKDVRTIWDLLKKHREAFERREQLLDEISSLRDSLRQELQGEVGTTHLPDDGAPDRRLETVTVPRNDRSATRSDREPQVERT